MPDQEENISSETHQEPMPLSLEGGSKQIELDMKPKPADKKTNIGFNKVSIKNIIDTPKEGPQSDPLPGSTNEGGSKPPKEPTNDILARLDDGGDKGSSSGGTPPSPEESKDGAGMLIDGFNALFLFFIELWSKDPDTQDYEVETDEKAKLKKYLASILSRSENKIPPLWLFVGLFIITYIPMFRKAYKHKKMVDEQRAKDDPQTIIIEGEPKRKRRRRNRGDDDAQFYHAEVVK